MPVLHPNFPLSSTEGLRSACLQAALLVARPRSTDAGRGHEMPGAETKDSFQLTVIAAARVSALMPGPNGPFPQGGAKWQVAAVPVVGWVLNLLSGTVSLPDLCPGGRHFLITLTGKRKKCLCSGVDTSTIFQDCAVQTFLTKQSGAVTMHLCSRPMGDSLQTPLLLLPMLLAVSSQIQSSFKAIMAGGEGPPRCSQPRSWSL